MNTPRNIPVTILTGFLGSGKTTLLNRILQEEHGKRIAVIENEFGEVGIDQALVIDADEEIFEMFRVFRLLLEPVAGRRREPFVRPTAATALAEHDLPKNAASGRSQWLVSAERFADASSLRVPQQVGATDDLRMPGPVRSGQCLLCHLTQGDAVVRRPPGTVAI